MRVLALLFLAAAAWGQKADEFSLTVDQFKGQNTYIDSSRLQNNSAQSAVNVLTEHGYVEKRTGNVLAGTFGAEVKNLHEYVKSSGSRLLMAHSGDYVKKTDLGTAATIVSTVVANGQVDFVSAFNKVVFVDAYSAVEYDGASTATVQGAPGCSLVEFDQNRLWCANIIAESQSMIRISSAGGTGYWTVPANPSAVADAPNLFYIRRDDGQQITCMKKTPWGMVAGKRNSMWIVKGFDNRNWYILNIDPSIGCTDDRTMQMIDGRLQWSGTNGVYSWPGAGPPRLESLEIDETAKSARQSTSQENSWAVDSQSDWLGGVLTGSGPGAPMSATLFPGSVTPSTWTVSDTSSATLALGTMTINMGFKGSELRMITPFRDGGFEYTGSTAGWSVKNWSLIGCTESLGYCHGSYQIATDDFAFPGPLTGDAIPFRLNVTNAADGSIIKSSYTYDVRGGVKSVMMDLSTFTSVTDVYIHAFSADYASYSVVSATFPISSFEYYVIPNCSIGSPSWCSLFFDVYESSYGAKNSSATFVSRSFDTGFSTPTFGSIISTSVFTVGKSTLTFYTQTSADNVLWDSSAPINASYLPTSHGRKYVRYVANFLQGNTTGPLSISSVTLQATTSGYYLSPVNFVGVDISSWGSFDVTQTLIGASSTTFQVRQATFTFSSTNTAISWLSQEPNQIITSIGVSTPTYFQWRVLMLPRSTTAYPLIGLVRTNWDSGSATSLAASGVLDHRYFLCVAISSSNNDTCMVQQQTRDWVIFSGPNYSAMTTYNNELLTGSPDSTGKVWRTMQSGVYNDDGTAIDAHWTSPDYMFGDPVSQKVVSEMWLDAKTSTGTIMNIGYSVDKSTTLINKALDIGSSPDVVNRRVPIASGFALGKYFRLKFSNAQDKYFRINGFTIFGQKKPRIE